MVREEKNLSSFLKATPDKWIESSYEVRQLLAFWLICKGNNKNNTHTRHSTMSAVQTRTSQ